MYVHRWWLLFNGMKPGCRRRSRRRLQKWCINPSCTQTPAGPANLKRRQTRAKVKGGGAGEEVCQTPVALGGSSPRCACQIKTRGAEWVGGWVGGWEPAGGCWRPRALSWIKHKHQVTSFSLGFPFRFVYNLHNTAEKLSKFFLTFLCCFFRVEIFFF